MTSLRLRTLKLRGGLLTPAVALRPRRVLLTSAALYAGDHSVVVLFLRLQPARLLTASEGGGGDVFTDIRCFYRGSLARRSNFLHVVGIRSASVITN